MGKYVTVLLHGRLIGKMYLDMACVFISKLKFPQSSFCNCCKPTSHVAVCVANVITFCTSQRMVQIDLNVRGKEVERVNVAIRPRMQVADAIQQAAVTLEEERPLMVQKKHFFSICTLCITKQFKVRKLNVDILKAIGLQTLAAVS